MYAPEGGQLRLAAGAILSMTRIVVAGGSFAGPFCAIQLTRRGHAVFVIRRDPFQVVVRPLDQNSLI